MKRIILTLAIIIASTTAFSQVTFKPGARTGINLANITNSDFDTKTDIYIGAFLEMKFADFYALQPELNYSRQGAKNPSTSGRDFEVQYLGLNLTNKFAPFTGLGLHAIIGPSFSFKVSDNQSASQNVERFDFGLMVGLGYEFPIGISVEARYNFGFVDIYGNNTVSVDDILLNKVIQIGVAYIIRLTFQNKVCNLKTFIA